MSNIKALMLSWEFPPNVVGGLSKHVDGLSRSLVQLGVQVHIITAYKEGLLSDEIYNGVYVHRVKPLNDKDESFFSWVAGLNLTMAMEAKRLAENIEFDLIHVHDWLSGAAGIALKKFLSLPLLTTIHATEFGRSGGIFNEMQRFIHEKEIQLINQSDKLIVCSHYMFKELCTVFKVNPEKLTILPNGIEPNMSLVKTTMMPEWKNKKIIFSIGRMVEEKGFETIIKAASLVKERGLEFFFIVAGKGPKLQQYRGKAINEKLEEQISFVGYISEIEKNAYILQSEVAVFPSLYEPFGIVALESMILGKPTIVSNTGGLKGIIQHRKTGLLMDPGNAESLLEQIEFLLTNPKKAKEIGRCGKKMVNRIYGWKHIAQETILVMEDLLLKTVF
ncbi:MAG: glycosyltransferase family 4 protein [Bacillota bacterium]|nr:glycosyltransferase family 4 protein [Bacillota bacterium]